MPHELVYKSKLDYSQLFRLFSTIFFTYTKGNSRSCTNNVQSLILAEIGVGWREIANGMELYNTIIKEL